MGLDIIAYSNIVKVGTAGDYDDFEERYDNKHIAIYRTGYNDRLAPLNVPVDDDLDVYRVDGEKLDFRAGSYSGYNWWRESIARLLTGFAPRELYWNRSGKTQEEREKLPLYYLINFSDCEGFIGPQVASILARQMREHRPTVAGKPELIELYDDFIKAFDLAAQCGVVIFR